MKIRLRTESTGHYVVEMNYGSEWQSRFMHRDRIETILNSITESGGVSVMFAHSAVLRNWTFNINSWLQQFDHTVDYICNRVAFDEIHCITKSEAELIVKRLEQLGTLHALRKDY